MTSLALMRAPSLVADIDPRVRLVSGCVLSIILALVQRFEAAWAGLALAAVLCVSARLPWAGLKMRLIGFNLFALFLFLTLPWSMPGAALWAWGPGVYSREGATVAALIAIKGNAILLVISALISTIEMTALGHAMEHLRLPARLVHLFLFTVRYLEQMHREYLRLVRAARARGFTPRLNRHTYYTYAQWVGMLFIRGLDRSERVLAAMKARGYRGRFYLLKHFEAGSRDVLFGGAVVALTLVLVWMEWM